MSLACIVLLVATATGARASLWHPGEAQAVLGAPALTELAPTLASTTPNAPAGGNKWGGRTVSIAVDPSNTNNAIAASENGGLWKSTDGGANWRHLDGLIPFNMADVKWGPNNTVIATVLQTTDTQNPGGIYRSTDGGATWSQPATARTICGSSGNSNGWGISFEPGSNNVYAAMDCGLAVSGDLGQTWSVITTPGLVWAVSAHSGGIVDLCGSAHYRYSKSGTTTALVSGPNTIPGGGCGNFAVNGLASAPQESSVLFAMALTTTATSCGGTSAKPVSVFQLYENDNSGVGTWSNIASLCRSGGGGRGFVVTHVSNVALLQFDIFYGGGLSVARGTCTAVVAGNRCTGLASLGNVTSSHGDRSYVAFRTDSTNCAQYLVDDGGVEVATSTSQPSCGNAFQMAAGSGRNGGYNALQLTEVNGQVHPGANTDLYIGTWHNDLSASNDGGTTWPSAVCCEGGWFETPHSASSNTGQIVTALDCGACFPSVFPGGLVGCNSYNPPCGFWTNPPSLPAGTAISAPFLIQPFVYLQTAQPSPPNTQFYIGTVSQPVTSLVPTLSWTTVKSCSTCGAFSVSQALVGRPRVAGPGSAPTVYTPYCRSNCGTASAVTGLAAITGLRSNAGAFTRVDSLLTNVGTYCQDTGEFGGAASLCDAAFGVDPNNPSHIIVADIGSSGLQMRESTDGGTTWPVDTQLTNLVLGTVGGTNRYLSQAPGFFAQNYSQVHAIAFDPSNANHIFVGTETAGVFASFDGGTTWSKIPGSERISNVSSFFFDEVHHDVLISSFGRGLWKLHLGALAINYELRGMPHGASVAAVDTTTGGTTTLIEDSDGVYRGLETTDTARSSITYYFQASGILRTVDTYTRILSSSEQANGAVYATQSVSASASITIPDLAIPPGQAENWSAQFSDDFSVSTTTAQLSFTSTDGLFIGEIDYTVSNDQVCLLPADPRLTAACTQRVGGLSTLGGGTSFPYMQVNVRSVVPTFSPTASGKRLTMNWGFTMLGPAASRVYDVRSSSVDFAGFRVEQTGRVGVTHFPTISALSPSSGTFAPSVETPFTVTVSDADGRGELSFVSLYIGSATVQYNAQTNQMIVGGQSCVPATTSTGSISSAYVSLNCNTSAVGKVTLCTPLGCQLDPNSLQITFALTFATQVSGSRYDELMSVTDTKGAFVGPVFKGNITIDRPPATALVSPTINTGQVPNVAQVFTANYTDQDGGSNLDTLQLQLATKTLQCILSNCKLVVYSVDLYYFTNTNTLAIANNGGSLLDSCAPGALKTLDSPLASLDCSATTPRTLVAKATLFITGKQMPWTVTPKSSMAGLTWSMIITASDDPGLTAGPTAAGSWTVNTSPNSGVNAPSSGTSTVGQSQKFVTSCSDPDGWHDIHTIDFKIAKGRGAGGDEPIALWVQFDQDQNLVRFYDPDSDTWAEGTPGSDAVLASRFAELHLGDTTVAGHGPTDPAVDITWDVVFKDAAVNDNYQQYLQITDNSGASTGFDKVGSWSVVP